MGLTRDYLRFAQAGTCNLISTANGTVYAVNNLTCAVMAAESVAFYNMRTLEKTYEIRCEGKDVTTFGFSREKSIIAIGYNDGEVHVHKRQEGSKIVFLGHRSGVNCLDFGYDGFILATGGKDSVIVLWDLVNETGICRFHGHKGSITRLQFVKGDKYLISSSKDAQIKFWSMASKSCFYTLAESASEIYSFALLNSDRLLVIGNAEIELLVCELCWNGQSDWDDFEIKESDLKRPRNEKNEIDSIFDDQANNVMKCRKKGTLMRQAKGQALQLVVSSDQSIICCVGADSLMDVYRHFTYDESKKRYNKKLRKMRQRLEIQEEEAIMKLEYEVKKDITTLITRIGDFRADSKIKWVDFCEPITTVGNGKFREYRFFCLLKANDVHGVALKIDWKSKAIESISLANLGQRVHRTEVRSIAFSSSEGNFFISGSQDSAIIWDRTSLSPLNKLTNDAMTQINALLVAFGDKQLILGTRTGSIFIFNVNTCDLIEKHEKVHEEAITQFCPFAHNNGFLSCGLDKKCQFWYFNRNNDLQGLTIRPEQVLELPDEILCACISPNNKYMAFGLLDNTARIYYMDTLKFFVSLYGHSLPIYSIDISPDNKLVITGSGDKSVRIWGLDFGDCHKSLFAHDDAVNCVKFCKDEGDEKLFWSAGKDRKLKQWDALKFHHVQTLDRHTDQINSIALSPDGKLLISASRDKSIRVWELSDEIIVMQEEEERKREEEYEQKLLENEDIVPGEERYPDGDLAPLKSIETVKSTESIIEAMEIIRKERKEKDEDPMHTAHILLRAYPRNSEYLFLLDIIQKIRSSHIEKSLLALPFTFVAELLDEMGKCMRISCIPEIASKIVLFIMRIHHNQIIHSMELLPIVNELKVIMPIQLDTCLNRTGFNIAALKFLQMEIERKKNAKMFNFNTAEAEKEQKKRKKRRKIQRFCSF